ncbi:MAG TPA: MBL fold metallo-hydrolase [Acidobacteriaceae bacterium]|nr:MBL fold metallo-hydrolase [Acidobacteriaceae bacterium]
MAKVAPLYFKNKQETEPKDPVGPFRTDPDRYATRPESGLRVTWFGHSSTLLEIDGMRVLIDPVWEQRASPFRWTGPRRFFAPTLRLEELPELDAVLISHDHYDHLGATTVQRLAELPCTERALWLTSMGVGRRLERLGVRDSMICEMDWTQTVEVPGIAMSQALKVTAWPARHFSGRGLHDRFSTLWSSFVFEGPQHRVFYGADSGWWDGFAAIAEKYDQHPSGRPGCFDLTMLEIGAYHPLWADIHLGPDGAVRAYKAMGGAQRAGALMPIHWGLFNLALHGWRQPIEQLEKAAAKDGIRLFAPEPGLPTEVNEGQGVRSGWWNGNGNRHAGPEPTATLPS